MTKVILFFLVTTMGTISCSNSKDPKSGVIVGKDSVSFTRKVSRKSYDTFQSRLSQAHFKKWDMDTLSAAYQAKVATDVKKYSISQITLNADNLVEFCYEHQSIRFIPTYFPLDPKNPGNPQDTVILMVGFDDGGPVKFVDIMKRFHDDDEPNRYPVFCPPPRGCTVTKK